MSQLTHIPPADIVFNENTASYDAVFAHLTKCNNNFIPKLDKKVDIGAYSKKIVENSVTFEAWADKELVGLIAAYFNDKTNWWGFITNVSVDMEYSGKGLASALMEKCIHFGQQLQFKAIYLEVFNQNKAAIKLYEKYGFYISTDSGADFVTMKKDL